MFSLEIKTYTKLNYIEYKPYLGCPIKNLGPRLQPTLFLCENGSEQNLNLNWWKIEQIRMKNYLNFWKIEQVWFLELFFYYGLESF